MRYTISKELLVHLREFFPDCGGNVFIDILFSMVIAVCVILICLILLGRTESFKRLTLQNDLRSDRILRVVIVGVILSGLSFGGLILYLSEHYK